MERTQNIKKIILLATLPFVLWLFFNQIAFWHYHILDNGMVVEHAHPFTNSTQPGTPYQNHHHTDFEHTLLAQLSNLVGLLVFLLVVGALTSKLSQPLPCRYQVSVVSSEYLKIHRLRGPPQHS